MSEERKRVYKSLNIDPVVHQEFCDAVYARHHKLHGSTKEEAEVALKAHAAQLRKEVKEIERKGAKQNA